MSETVELSPETAEETEISAIALQHSHRVSMSVEMSMNAKKFAEELGPISPSKYARGNSYESVDQNKEPKQSRGAISAIRNMTFLGSGSRGPDSSENRGGISAIRNLTFFGGSGQDSEGRSVSAMRNMTFLWKRDDNAADVETKGISAVRNMTFLLGKPGIDNKTSLRRSMSAGYAPASTRRDGDHKKIIVGRNLTTRRLPLTEPDEIDNEVHRVLGEKIGSAVKCFAEGDSDGKQTEVADDNVIQCITRMSSVYIGTDSLFPLSTIPVNDTLQFQLKFDDFLFPEHITDGSNSCIYSARNKTALPHGPESVVLKVLNEDLDDLTTAKREFDYERDILAAISSSKTCHPNIIQFLGSGSHMNDIPFLVVERLDGGSLTYLLNKPRNAFSKDHPFSVVTAIEILRSLANAVKYLHWEFHPDAVLIHRDIKPDNICFTSAGALKLMDFGISTCVRRQVLQRGPYAMTGMSGSLRYMAPEVANCEPYDQSVDVYSFGILMYQVLTGITPFLGCKREKFMLDVVQNNMRPIVAPVEALAADRRCCRETSDKLIGMMRRCWDPNRISRPTILIVYEELVAMHASELAMKDAGGCCVPAV